MQDCKVASTPLPVGGLKLEENQGGSYQPYPYQSLIGSLMFVAMNTRPDIAFAVSYLSQFNSCYGKAHWLAAKRVLQYLKGSINWCIVYKKSSLPLLGYADADWANCVRDRRSYTGYYFKLSSGPVCWESKKQPTVALSSTEAEYMALTAACKEACYLRRFIAEVTGKLHSNITIYNDSQSAQKLVSNPVHHGRTKHIDTRYHIIREKVSENVVKVKYLSTSSMPADVLTKPLGSIAHKRCVTEIGLG